MKTATFALFFVALVNYSYQKSTSKSNSYVAAVVEFSSDDPKSMNDPPNEINAARYVSYVEKAAAQNADIIVFPEAGLTSINIPPRHKLESWTTIVPSPSDNYIPCIHATIPVSKTLKTMSCSARDNMIYVVINLSEKVICANETCSDDEKLYFNTNVVFDREGKIIARYRKTNLFLEPGFNVTKIPEVVTFDTDFGVTFGTFICFDILFRKPAMYLTRMLNVTDIVFPTAWLSEVPFLTALQIQAGWSYAEDTNFLVAGYNNPKLGHSGSGIYLGRQGIAKAIIPISITSEMLIAKVPKKNDSSSNHRSHPRYDYNMEEVEHQRIDGEFNNNNDDQIHDEFRRRRRSNFPAESLKYDKLSRTKRSEKPQVENLISNETNYLSLFYEDLRPYQSERLDSSISRDVCDGEFCCHFDVRMAKKIDETYQYRMFAYNGKRMFPNESVTVGIGICSIVLCSNDSITSCGRVEKSETVFHGITINATFSHWENLLIMPNSLDSNFYPLGNWQMEERYEDKKIHILANLTSSTKNIVACGIYARDFDKDSWIDRDESKSGMQWATLTALAMVSIFLLFLYRKGWRKPWQRNNQLSSDAGPYQHLRTQ